MSEAPTSARSSGITDLVDDPATPTPSGRSGVVSELPSAPHPQRIILLDNEGLSQRSEDQSLQASMLQTQRQMNIQMQRQTEVQEQVLQQQRAFEDRMNTLVRSNYTQRLPGSASELAPEKAQ
jgi:hypothetical protein